MSKERNITSFKAGANRWFKTDINYKQSNLKVDFENGVIHDVAVVTVGEAKGHGVSLEQSFVNDVVKLGNEYGQGLKSRFGHPNMSSEALGTYLGRFKNFRVDGTKAIADLHLDPVAKQAPGGDLYSYVLGMAESNPDMFGASIVFTEDYLYQYDDKGNIVVLQSSWSAINDGPVYVKIKELFATDIVDEPAANDGGLFSSAAFNSDQFAVRITEFLDDNPDVWQFVEQHPEKFQPFLEKYAAYQQKKSTISMGKNTKPKGFFKKLADAITNLAAGEDVMDEEIPVPVVTEDAPGTNDTPEPAASEAPATEEPAAPETSNQEPATEELSAAQWKQKFEALQVEFEAFKKKPAANHTTVGAAEDGTSLNADGGDPDAAFYNQPWNKKARKTA